MLVSVIVVIVVICSLVQLGYYLYFFSRIFLKKNNVTKDFEAPEQCLSVIICAKNEAQNLANHLPYILEQKYHSPDGKPQFEVIVVNDRSTDNSKAILAGFQEKYKHLKVVNIAPDTVADLPGKKFALRAGVAIAQYDMLVMTDADCKPASENWLNYIGTATKEKSIVAGYGGYEQRNSFLNLFIRCETIHTFLQYCTYQRAGLPYMAVGRNLACHKSFILKASENELWSKVPSGDDDLLISLCATKDNMIVLSNPNAATYSPPKENFAGWVAQKQRHFSTGKLYKPIIQRLLGIYAMTHAWGWIGFVWLHFFNNSLVYIGLYLWLLRTLVFFVCMVRTAKLVQERFLWIFLLIFDVFWLPYNLIFAPYIFWKNKQQWK